MYAIRSYYVASETLPIIEIPVPLMFQMPKSLIINPPIVESAARAAQVLDTFLIIRPEDYSDSLLPYARNLIPSFTCANTMDHDTLIQQSRVVELTFGTDIEDTIHIV